MEYTRDNVIGQGGFSTVWLARPKKQGPRTPQVIAVKTSKHYQATTLLHEQIILKKFKGCPHIIQCFGSNYGIEKGEKMYNLLLEYASGGTLADRLKKQTNCRFLESDIRRYAKSILEGIKCMHKKGYVHRDLKLENILLCSSSKGAPKEVVKIADFGLAKRVGERGEGEASKLGGTPLYLSPEAVAKSEQEPPADVWALGCLVAEMFSGAPLWHPRQGEGAVDVMMRIALCEEIPEISGDLSPDGRDFLGKIFTKDPAKRWTASKLLRHPFIVDQPCEKANPLQGSPGGPLDWTSDYKSSQSTCSVTKVPSSKLKKGYRLSVLERFKRLMMCQEWDWSISR